MNLLNNTKLLSLLAMFCFVLLAGAVGAQEAKKSVAILPFTLNAPPDRQYLQEGLRDMLGSRLRTETGADIVSKTDVDGALRVSGGKLMAENMQSFAKTVGADYLIYGTITALGGGISIDAQVFSAAAPADKAVQAFYGSAVANDQVMKSIDSLAWDIIEQLFDKNRPAAMLPAQQQAPVKEQGVSGFTTAHPDKTFMASGGGYGLAGARNFIKTRNFNMTLTGVDLGDIDGDGTLEVILASKTEVMVFNRNETRLNSIATISMGNRYNVHSVGTADLNGNGRAEIYISASDPEIPGSRAVEWDGKQFVDLFNEARWYIRPVNVPGTGPVLVGQAAGLLPVEPGIFQLAVNGGSVSAQEKLPIPSQVNLFNFAYADLDGDGQQDLVALDESFKLLMIKGGSVLWKSGERFGGTKRYVGGDPNLLPSTRPTGDENVDGIGERYRQTFIPSRIMVTDVDKDGVDDIVINRNPDTLTTVTPRMIQYESGTMVGLKWNGLGLEEMWRTRKISGYVVDYQVKSQVKKLGEGEHDEMFVGVILNAGTLDALTGDVSTVIIYPFEFEKVESPQQ